MRLPRQALEAARRALAACYGDTAAVTRAKTGDGRIERRLIAGAMPCHLSYDGGLGARRGEALRQGPAGARAGGGGTLFCPPDAGIEPGDLLVIAHRGREVRARAGRVTGGGLSLAVRLEEETLA